MKFKYLPLALLTFISTCRSETDPISPKFTYSGDSLRNIAFPIGGIGTGNILLGGRGNILELEIFGRANRDGTPPYMTFFSLWLQQEGEEPVSTILEGELPDDFPNVFGVNRNQLAGLPRFEKNTFTGEFPYAKVKLQDENIPLTAELLAYNPFIPLSPDLSGIPVAIFYWSFQNLSDKKMDASVCLNMGNPFFQLPGGYVRTTGNVMNESFERDEYRGVLLKSLKGPGNGESGGIAILTNEKDVDMQTSWYRGGWWDDAHIFWDDFSADGKIVAKLDTIVNEGGIPDVAALNVHLELLPGEEKTVPFYITWYMPERKLEENMAFDNEEVAGAVINNYYAAQYSGAIDIAASVLENLDSLISFTKKYHDIVYRSTYPEFVKDALTANTAGLKTNLVLRDGEVNFHGYEGLGMDFGCCAGNCTHVWNYAQTMASLFPSLERNVREIGFLHDTHENGYQCFRTVFPLSKNYFKNVAADGQMGNIVRVYREWKNSGDTEWLKKLWPSVKAALEFAWTGSGELASKYPWMDQYRNVPWDVNKEGVLRGDQHNTYDINFFGPNMMTGSLYLGALKACAEMAVELGEDEKAREYTELYMNGKKTYDELLWNGEFYIQKVEVAEGIDIPDRLKSPPDEHGNIIPKYQYGEGCLSDQLLGQFLSFNAGLGYILPEEKVKKALKSIYQYNFIESFSGFENVQRVYALNDEAGLVICTWPNGNRPVLPFVYADETWTGIEYQVAASLIYTGMVEEGLSIVEAVRNRYRGYNRNPWAEIESGAYYARAMSSWAVLLALSGFEYDGVNHSMSFNPKINQNRFYTFWSAGNGWGSLEIEQNHLKLTVEFGNLILKEFGLTGDYENNRVSRVMLNDQKTEAEAVLTEKQCKIHFKDPILLRTGQSMTFSF